MALAAGLEAGDIRSHVEDGRQAIRHSHQRLKNRSFEGYTLAISDHSERVSCRPLHSGVLDLACPLLSVIVLPVRVHIRDPFRVGLDLRLMLQFASDVVQLRDAREPRKSENCAVGKVLPLPRSQMLGTAVKVAPLWRRNFPPPPVKSAPLKEN